MSLKKLSLLLFFTLLFGSASLLKAQCYGTVVYDQSVNFNGASSFNISTTVCDELIMICYDGWSRPGTGPVTVDGNPATWINTAFNGINSGVAETYAYLAPTPGVHNIVCTEAGYNSPYFLNFAADFYATGTCNPLSIASITSAIATTSCATCTGIPVTITTTIPGTMLFGNFENNSGLTGPFTNTWTGATSLSTLHIGNGIDASDAYAPEAVPGTYTIRDSTTAPHAGGGIVMVLCAIPPPLCGGACSITLTPTTINPTCGNNNGSIVIGVAGGSGPYTYVWSPAVSTSASATGLSAGSYTITVNGTGGGCNTASITVNLTTTVLNVVATVSTNDLCTNSTNGSGTSVTTGGTGPYTYAWTPSGGTNANVSGLTAGTYTITSTDINGCTGSASITITAPPALTTTITGVNIKCNGASTGSATVTAGGGTPGYKYSWAPAGGTNATASNLSATTYTVTVTDANGCTATASIALTQPTALNVTATITAPSCGGSNGSATANPTGGTPGYKYAWAPVGGTNATATGLSAATYTVTVTDANGCTQTATAVVAASSTLTTIITATNVLCGGGNTGTATAVPNGGTTPYTYLWTPVGQTNQTATGLTAGSYTLTVTDAIGCTATASVTLTQPTPITLLSAGFPVTCNGGDDGQATVIPAGGTTPYTYLWSGGTTNANADDLTATTYTITVTDANGCSATATASVTQPAAIQVGFDSDTLKGCYPLCFYFGDLSVDPTPGDTIKHWNWDFGDGGQDTNQNPRHCYTGPGTYSVKLTVVDNKGCSNSHTNANMITVYQHPSPDFSVSPQPTTIYQPNITFTDLSSDPYGIVSWSWNFNDPLNDTGSTLQNPSHAYSDTGIYCPMLTVTNIHGCVDSISHCLVISPQYSMYIPDAFSPNGDGKNDMFLPRGEYIQQYSLNIFDRWGMRIFSTTDMYQGWDGKASSGRLCQEDTYIYLIDITDNLGKKHSYLGKVTLIK
ncbi:MAG TPA: PKD domain-containing protein [Bacteroidia bacterium]|nr:PKD domain-containing protein [Bacteroidia bacterium]